MLSAHMPSQVTLYPDTQRAVYNPGDKITITVNAMDVDYIQFEDSVLWVSLEMTLPQYLDRDGNGRINIDNTSVRFKYPALGGASLVDRFRIDSGTTILQDYEEYWALWATLAEMSAPRGFSDPSTFYNKTRCATEVMRMQATHSSTNAYDPSGTITTYPVWIQIPLISVLNDAGFIPNYQTANKIKLHITLSQNDAIFASSIYRISPSFVAGDPNVYLSGYEPDQETMPKIITPRDSAGVNVYDAVEDLRFTWALKDCFLRASGLTVLNGGHLDANPVEIFTHSYQTMTTPTNGMKNERVSFQIKKSSIRKMHAIFTSPSVKMNQDFIRPTQRHWMRAGSLGARLVYDVDPPIAGTGTHAYDPSITWFAVELGGKRFPTSSGTGEERNPVARDTNVAEMYRAYSRFNGINDMSGTMMPLSLTPYDEHSHGSMFLTSRIGDMQGTFQGRYAAQNVGGPVGAWGAFNIGNVASHPFAAHPAWTGMTASLYGGFAARFGYRPWDFGVLPYQKVSLMPTSLLTSGKFIMATTFASMDRSGKLIQGIDTERYDMQVVWSRLMPIIEGFVVPGSQMDGPNVHDVLWRTPYTMTEEIPMMIAFFDFDVKLTIQNGVITLDD